MVRLEQALRIVKRLKEYYSCLLYTRISASNMIRVCMPIRVEIVKRMQALYRLSQAYFMYRGEKGEKKKRSGFCFFPTVRRKGVRP